MAVARTMGWGARIGRTVGKGLASLGLSTGLSTARKVDRGSGNLASLVVGLLGAVGRTVADPVRNPAVFGLADAAYTASVAQAGDELAESLTAPPPAEVSAETEAHADATEGRFAGVAAEMARDEEQRVNTKRRKASKG